MLGSEQLLYLNITFSYYTGYATATPPLEAKNTGKCPTDSSGLSAISQSLPDSILGLLINGKVSRAHTQTVSDYLYKRNWYIV